MSPAQTFFRLLRYFFQYKWRILAGLLSVAVMSSSDAASAYLIARLFDILQTISQQVRAGQEIFVEVTFGALGRVFWETTIQGRSESFQLIFRFAAAVLVIIGIKVCFVYAREYLMSSVQQKILMRFRVDLFDTIVVLPVKYFDRNKTGFIMSRITNDVNNLEVSLTLMIEIAQNIVYTLVFTTALFYTNWQLTIVTLVIFAVSGEISRKFGDRIRSFSRDLTNTLAEISAFLQEKIAAMRIVKASTREEYERKAFRKRVESNYHFSMKIVRVVALLSPTNELFNTAATSVMVIFSAYLFIQGVMTMETMLFFLILMINLAKPVKALGESAARIQKTLVSAGYIFDILDLPREDLSGPGSKDGISTGTVEFRDVSFTYEGDAPALQHISFTVKSGERVALVGPSGGGKSTLINLIPRFYELSQGTILIDGRDTRGMNLGVLRSEIATVPQDVLLFSGTVYDNVRYGRLEATEEEIVAAAKAANAHEFILRLERGYQTEVGERAVQLSGGQRQRIAIARAILRDPKILLLDEATSALDTEAEQMVQQALNRLMEGRTSFIIAHRLSTVAYCDRIFVLDRGRVVESGTHAELVNRESGLYRKLHALQFADQPRPT